MSRRWHGIIVASLSLAVSLLAKDTNVPFQLRLPDVSLWPQGRFVHQRNCLVCPGAYDDGRGEMGRKFNVKPRDFGRGIFKYHSTSAGKTDDQQWELVAFVRQCRRNHAAKGGK